MKARPVKNGFMKITIYRSISCFQWVNLLGPKQFFVDIGVFQYFIPIMGDFCFGDKQN
jgi:hypothetical protein